jgi:hypothetical protein
MEYVTKVKIKVTTIGALILMVILALTSYPLWGDSLEDYNKGYAKGWENAYSQLTKLKEYPEAPKFTALLGKEEELRWDEQGIIDGINFASSDILNMQWENYNWWQKILNPEHWFLVTFITD